MELEMARDIMTGKKLIDILNTTKEEAVMLLMGACLTDEGDIICLECSLPNECCKCGMEEGYDNID